MRLQMAAGPPTGPMLDEHHRTDAGGALKQELGQWHHDGPEGAAVELMEGCPRISLVDQREKHHATLHP
jgi:hypothetical protein